MTPDLPTVYLARHGATEWSKNGRHTGRTDLPLLPEGEADGRKLADRLAGVAFAHVFTSPLSRAARTADLAGFGHAVRDPAFLEWDYGRYDGQTTAEIRADRPGWDLFRDGCPDGESPDQVTARIDAVVGRLKGLHGNVLVFAHGHLLRVLAARWLNEPVTFAGKLLLSTGTLSRLGFDHHRPDEPAIAAWNS